MSAGLCLPKLKRHTIILVTSQPPRDILNVDRGKPKPRSDIAKEGLYIFGGVDETEQSQGKLIYVDTSSVKFKKQLTRGESIN